MPNNSFLNVNNQKQIDVIEKDRFGNPQGQQYDLAKDNSFSGQKIAVLHLYTGEGFDFELPKLALAQKGFEIAYWKDVPPSPSSLKNELRSCCQLWIVSDAVSKLQAGHLEEITEFFEQGKGIYLLGDNDPYFADANAVAHRLLQVELYGNFYGDKVLGLYQGSRNPGLLPGHDIFTGIEHLYEGITVSMLGGKIDIMTPLIYGSNGLPIAATYEMNNRRVIIDGGFTRLYCKWDSAGTARYVVNVASWLAMHKKSAKVQSINTSSPKNIIDKF